MTKAPPAVRQLWLGLVAAAAAMLFTAAVAMERPQPLVLESVETDVWRADARGTKVEFRLTRSPPPAREVTLTDPAGVVTRFRTERDAWISQASAGAPRDGSLLSIVEPNHRHDFRLNVHTVSPPAGSGAGIGTTGAAAERRNHE